MLARVERLVGLLNDDEVPAELLEQLAELQTLLDNLIAKGRHIIQQTVFPENADRDTGLWCYWMADKKVAALLRSANRRLAKDGWKILEMVKLTRQGPPTVPLGLKNPLRPLSGNYFGFALRDCLEDRSLWRARRCPVCETWFVANRGDQLHCSRRCSKQSSQRKHPAEWAAYMKVYRRMDRIREHLLPVLREQRKSARSSDRRKISIEISQLEAEYKSLLKKRGKRHDEN